MAFKMFLILFWESPTTVLHECNDKKYRKNSSKILKKLPFFGLKFEDFLMSSSRLRVKIIFEKSCKIFMNFL